MAKKSRFIIFLLILIYPYFHCYSQNIPQRIISLGPSITEELYILGVDNRLIANTIYCVKPPEAKLKEKIGTVVDINIEKIFNLRPDLIIATSLTNPKAKEKLKNLGIKVISFSEPKNFNQIYEQFLELAKLVGKEREAKEIINNTKKNVKRIIEMVNSHKKLKVLIQVGTKPLFVATGESFLNDYIEYAGGINIAKDAKQGIYSREEVLRRNPDIIIIVTMGIAGEEERKVWQNYKSLNAVKNGRIYVVDSDKFCSPTPLSLIDNLKEMVSILHEKEVIK